MKKRVVLHFDLGQVCNDVLAKCNLVGKSIKEEALEDIKASILSPDDPETRCIINRSMTEAIGRVKVACQRYLNVGRMEDDNKLERLVASVTYPKKEVQATDDDGHLLIDLHLTVIDSAFEGCYKVGEFYYKDGHKLLLVKIDSTDPIYSVGYKEAIGGFIYIYSAESSMDPQYLPEPPKYITAEDFSEDPTPVMEEVDDLDNPIPTYEVVTLILDIESFNLAVTDDLKSAIHKFLTDYVMGKFLQDQHADKAAEYMTLAEGKDYSQIIKDLNAREVYTMRRASFM